MKFLTVHFALDGTLENLQDRHSVILANIPEYYAASLEKYENDTDLKEKVAAFFNDHVEGCSMKAEDMNLVWQYDVDGETYLQYLADPDYSITVRVAPDFVVVNMSTWSNG